MFLQLALEALEQGKGVRRPTGETRDDLTVVEPADLTRVALHDGRCTACLLEEKLLTLTDTCCALTERGMCFHDYITAQFVDQMEA